jgi:hypothetical protein
MGSHYGYLEDEEFQRYPLLEMRQQRHISGEGVLKKKSKTLRRAQNSTYERQI